MSSICARRIGIVSADLHNRFVTGNSEGRITAAKAVVSAFLASHGILRYGSITDEMRRRAAAALEAAGVDHLARRTLDQMSSGEARRVMLARALVNSPRALVLDEPTTGLDLVARHGFMERVREVARAGTTLILITHHIEEIVPEISRVVLLREGKIIEDGPKPGVLTRRVADPAVRHSCGDGRSRWLPLRTARSQSRQLAVTRKHGESLPRRSCPSAALAVHFVSVPPPLTDPSIVSPVTRPVYSAFPAVNVI